MRIIEINGSYLGKRVHLKFNPHFVPQIWIIEGEQGCGKSTMLRAVFFRLWNIDREPPRDQVPIDGYDMMRLADEDTGLLCLASYEDRLWWGREIAHQYKRDNGLAKLEALERWVKAIPEQSVILLDNLEDGLSAVNQYNLTRQWLLEWNPTAQFIIASHSGSMCQPLTPAHILEM